MSTQKEIEDHLRRFTEREQELFVRAKACGVDVDHPAYREWPTWFGDSVVYLNALRNEIEVMEAQTK